MPSSVDIRFRNRHAAAAVARRIGAGMRRAGGLVHAPLTRRRRLPVRRCI